MNANIRKAMVDLGVLLIITVGAVLLASYLQP